MSSYKSLISHIDSTAKILEDKAYVGLEGFNVKTPSKKNELRYKENPIKSKKNNKNLSKKRIKVENVFAQLKSYRILQKCNYYKTKTVETFFNTIANLYNLGQILK